MDLEKKRDIERWYGMKVKSFQAPYADHLEVEINKWILENPEFKVIQVNHTVVLEGLGPWYSAMVLYEAK